MTTLKKFIFSTIALLAITFSTLTTTGCWLFSGSENKEIQIDTAEKWLIAMDHKKYEQCYQETAQEFKNAKNLSDFLLHCKKDRATYGLVRSRSLVQTKTVTDKRGNTYFFIKFKTFFSKDNAFEILYLSEGKSKNYQIAKYYIINF
ncbi:DUF4019 domain-containing protein [Lentisphaerota bacterium WC36G]|nr:DUF4019 domain-containing protein [Lentisphaerae bacterium WC36]